MDYKKHLVEDILPFWLDNAVDYENGGIYTCLDKKGKIDSSTFVSMGKATPFDGYDVYGEIIQTYVDGKLVYDDNK